MPLPLHCKETELNLQESAMLTIRKNFCCCVINSDKRTNDTNEGPHDPTIVLSPPSRSSSSSSSPSSSPQASNQPTCPLRVDKTLLSRGKIPLTIVHFNDVYNIEGRDKEPVGGVARFQTSLKSFGHLHPLTLFSGDALSPSNISVVMKGEQMVPVLNELGIHCAVYGNHDFDFGVEHLVRLARKMKFPWLMSNVESAETGSLLADGHEYYIIQWNQWKVGLMGLVEMEWIETLGTLEPKDVKYTDYVEKAKELIPKLEGKGCDLIIALTHMRVPNDQRLAREVPELHMVLGGHDHGYEKEMIGDVLMLKSGSEFREFSVLTVQEGRGTSRPEVKVQHCKITKEVTPDESMDAIVEEYLGKVKEGLEVEIGYVHCNLEDRCKQVRTRETNLGNLVTDIMRKTMKADVAILNSGTLRSDCIHEAGVLKMKDLLAILPIVDSVMLLELSGAQLLEALENGVSQYPKHEGRFPQVSGITFTFDPTQPSGHRVIGNVKVGGASLEEDRIYKVCTKGYIGKQGKDGYDVFRRCRQLIPEDEGPTLFIIVREYFEANRKLCLDQTDGTDGEDGRKIAPQVEGRISICPHSESSGSE